MKNLQKVIVYKNHLSSLTGKAFLLEVQGDTAVVIFGKGRKPDNEEIYQFIPLKKIRFLNDKKR